MLGFVELKTVPEELKKFGGELFLKAEIILDSYKIQQQIESGEKIQDILFRRLPNLSSKDLETAAFELEAGVLNFYEEMDKLADEKQIKKELNNRLSDLTDNERKTFLINVITAMVEAYPDLSESFECLERFEEIKQSENCSEDEISVLLDYVNICIEKHSGLLTRQSVDCMKKGWAKMDSSTVEQMTAWDIKYAKAYAVAGYIAQQCGKSIKVNGTDVDEMSAYMVGSESAAVIESSKLMAYYTKGTLTLNEISLKLKSIYHYVLANAVKWIVRGTAILVQIKFGIILFETSKLLLSFLANLNPYIFIAASLALAIYADTVLVHTKDFEDVIYGLIHAAKAVWSFFADKIKKLTAHTDEEANQVNVETNEDVEEELFSEDEIDQEKETVMA